MFLTGVHPLDRCAMSSPEGLELIGSCCTITKPLSPIPSGYSLYNFLKAFFKNFTQVWHNLISHRFLFVTYGREEGDFEPEGMTN